MATTPTRLSKQARREQLFDAAVSIVRANGADGLTLPTLAEAAGVSRPIVYDHFGTRSGLLLALYRRLDERHRAATMQALEQAPPTAGGVAAVISAAYFACATDMPELNAISAALKGDPDMEAIQHEMYDSYTDVIADALTPYSGMSRAALRLHCVGVFGAAEAIAGELNRGTATVDDAITALTGVLLAASATGERYRNSGH
ncbi:TetR/AcrR family transcriptional regulator [Nocardia cyriacigeorgica]|uniref:TetR/AcrR family transcriptional regulator n=1 Tax=Nocardia cyriacigeorgica TaxID=135487 RepID=A0A6P1D8B7_9NOCA|nr:TetR/AcrR family transcriptional regulator [Nocardia cyriacigeorgica]NEW37600.1 TetR/AcrR family transcriptional regulator [Nocardia cyriacigeorgica]NEW45043.1 TetR/AcrR family transcriptional regulator [Nocardia cyriacigeorgica]NEW49012.1 TetR/AcrR family transcriptional regulator [Nocardia cyriacigeorgica]